VIEERPTRGGLPEDRAADADRLLEERAVLQERLAALGALSLERERRITDLRAALAILLKAEQRRAAEEPPPPPLSPAVVRRLSSADPASMTEAERATWDRELARTGHPNRRGKVWETFEDFPPPRLRDKWREIRRGR
jgi:hypothetical protein